jgi:hypothetical protein
MSRFQLAYRNSHFASLSYVNKALQIDPEHCDSLLQRAIAHAASPHSAPQDTRLYFRIAAASQVRRHLFHLRALAADTWFFFHSACLPSSIIFLSFSRSFFGAAGASL